jgi:hypothetical protein
MTIEERNDKLKHFITCLKCEVSGKCCDDNCSTQYDAGNMGEIIENLEAISKALEQEPFINKPCVSNEVCEHDKNKVLDKVRAEIVELTKCPYGTECLGANCPSNTDCMICGDHVLEIIDKYRTESEE